MILKKPLYIVLQEPSGTFGPVVQQNLFTTSNLKISSSKSGKMEKDHLNEWVQDVFIPNANQKSLLIIDSWSTFTEENIRQKIPENKQVNQKCINLLLYLYTRSVYLDCSILCVSSFTYLPKSQVLILSW